jgi:structural maintenance of chromosome 2
MKNYKNDNRKRILTFVLSVVFLFSCGDNSSDNSEYSKNNSSEFNLSKDTIKSENEKLDRDTESIKKQLIEVSQKADEAEYRLRLAKLEVTNNLISELKKRKNIVDDSLNLYASQLTEINFKIEELYNKKKYVVEANEKSGKNVTTSITDLENAINTLKISLSKEKNNLKLVNKRRELLTKKSELLNTELEYKMSELNELYSQKNAQNQIKEINAKIAEINEEIDKNKNQLLEEELNQKLNQNKVTDLEKQISEKQKLFKTEYEKSVGFTDYLKQERQAIDNQITKLEKERKVFSNKWKNFKVKKEQLLSELDEAETNKTRLLIQKVDEADSAIVTKDDLAKVEEKKDNIGTEIYESVDSIDSYEEKDKIDSVEQESTAIEKLIKAAKQSAESSIPIYYWIIIIIIFVVVGLYWLGKISRKKSK